jgi:hypothetical protein
LFRVGPRHIVFTYIQRLKSLTSLKGADQGITTVSTDPGKNNHSKRSSSTPERTVDHHRRHTASPRPYPPASPPERNRGFTLPPPYTICTALSMAPPRGRNRESPLPRRNGESPPPDTIPTGHGPLRQRRRDPPSATATCVRRILPALPILDCRHAPPSAVEDASATAAEARPEDVKET